MGLLSGKTYDTAAGRESRSAFIAMAAFWICALKFIANGVSFRIFSHAINLGTVDAALMGAFLVPCLALYWGRRSLRYGDQQPSLTSPPTDKGAVG